MLPRIEEKSIENAKHGAGTSGSLTEPSSETSCRERDGAGNDQQKSSARPQDERSLETCHKGPMTVMQMPARTAFIAPAMFMPRPTQLGNGSDRIASCTPGLVVDV